MKKTLSVAFVTLFGFYAFSQNLVVSKSSGEEPIQSLLLLNSNTGEILDSLDYETAAGVGNLIFNPQTNEIIVYDDYDDSSNPNNIRFKNIVTGNETYILLTELTGEGTYQNLIIADNRLFVTTGDIYSENTIQEINSSDGSVIASHTLTTVSPLTWNSNLTYSNTTKEIYGVSGNTLWKFNIMTNQETTFVLPNTFSGSSTLIDIVIAENRFFVLTNYVDNNGNMNKALLEINPENGLIINTHIYNYELFSNENNDFRSLTFLADTQEICIIATGGYGWGHLAKIVKYNINTGIESEFDLPSLFDGVLPNGGYGDIVSLVTEESLSLPDFNQENKAKVIKAYNLLGQEVPVETNNQIIILKYDNGQTKKFYNIQK